MFIRNRYKVIVSIGLVLVVALLIGILVGGSGPENRETIMQLARPAFIDVASAEELAVIDTIVNEAGIAAYFKLATSVTLADVRDAFRTIEAETSSYIIGSVAVPNNPETEDVHVYIHKDGWFLAYYLAQDPSGKIFDWISLHNSGRTNMSTKLENILVFLAAEASVVMGTETYYDFRQPNATNLMLIAEWRNSDSDTFEVNIPSSFVIYERSWSLGAERATARYYLDGNKIIDWWTGGWHTDQGTFTAPEFLPDQYHEILVNGDGIYIYGGLALVYKVP